MGRSRKAFRARALVAVFGLGLSIAGSYPGPAGAQLRDPPPGWDMWYPGWTREDAWQPERMDRGLRWRMTRHEAFIRNGVPAPYAGARNPMPRTPATISEGGALYARDCAACHDETGMGDGDAGNALYPSPALLAHLLRMPDAVDEYLLWAISEGGKPFGTAMPAFEGSLTRDQIWQIITYMRSGFPPLDGSDAD
jgi:mono/diheme cytochrome c family protein